MRTRYLFVFVFVCVLSNTVLAAEARFYDNRGRRDPFVPLLGVSSQALGSLEDVISIEDIILQGVASDSSGEKIVIINGEMIKEGKTVGRVTVKRISENDIILTIDGTEYTLKVSEEIQ